MCFFIEICSCGIESQVNGIHRFFLLLLHRSFSSRNGVYISSVYKRNSMNSTKIKKNVLTSVAHNHSNIAFINMFICIYFSLDLFME